MSSPPFSASCTRTDGPGQTAAAAIAEIARRHGLDVSPREVLARARRPAPDMDLFAVLLTARRCGFEVVPLEGGFDELPEVPRPNIVLFRGPDERPDYMVLLAIDADSAVIADTIEGRERRLSRADFTARWTGDALQILPDAAGFAAFRRELLALRNPWLRRGRRLGLVPLTARKLRFAALALLPAAALLVPGAPLDLALRAALGLAALLSLWLTLFSATCASCSGAAALVGALPLAPAGLALYGALLAALTLHPGAAAPLLAPLLAAAAAAHAALLLRLLRSPHRCVPCLGVAAAVLTALALAQALHPVAPALAAAVFLASLAATHKLADLARDRLALALRDGGLRLAARTLAEPAQPGPGRARLIVYTLPGCPACNYYEMVVRGLLAQEFGSTVTIEERRPGPGEPVTTPLFVVRGSADVLVEGFPADQLHERLRSVLTAVLAPGPRDLQPCGGIHLVHPPTRYTTNPCPRAPR